MQETPEPRPGAAPVLRHGVTAPPSREDVDDTRQPLIRD